MAPPVLIDEMIGSIFDHLAPRGPGKLLPENPDKNTLKTCTLVSRQFGFWARRGLYQSIHIRRSAEASHYLDLCKRYTDIPSHIKTLRITILDGLWNPRDKDPLTTYDDLVSLLDLLVIESAVTRFHLVLRRGWDNLTPSLQDSILVFIFSRSHDVLEIDGLCHCFEIDLIPIAWITQRFFLPCYDACPVEGDGRLYPSCPNWENERRKLGPNAPRGRKPRNEQLQLIMDVYDHLHDSGALHPEKTRLESIWVYANILPFLQIKSPYGTAAAERLNFLREVHLTHLRDGDVPSVVILLKGCKDTLESLMFYNLQFRSATSSDLSLLASVDLPCLRSLTIMTHIELSGIPIKSMAWYLLHARKSKKFQLESLNLIFMDATFQAGISFIGCIRNSALIQTIFDLLKFFKLESVVADLLDPRGKLGLWFLMASTVGAVEEGLVEKSVKGEFPKLHQKKGSLLPPDKVTRGPELSTRFQSYRRGLP